MTDYTIILKSEVLAAQYIAVTDKCNRPIQRDKSEASGMINEMKKKTKNKICAPLVDFLLSLAFLFDMLHNFTPYGLKEQSLL